MGYAGARGGEEAIRAAEELVRRRREEATSPRLGVDQIVERLGLAVDRLMGESGMWAPELTARALRQAEGDTFEATNLLRSYRSTLPRLAYSLPADVRDLRVIRRISSAFRNPPGGQVLGRTFDYVGRLLDLSPDAPDSDSRPVGGPAEQRAADEADRHPPRVTELLGVMDWLTERHRGGDPEPYDITRQPARPGAPRSAVLSSLARAETGALIHFWYALRFDPKKPNHEIPGEVRHGYLPVPVTHPLTGNPVHVAEVRVTHVETYDDLDRPDEDSSRIEVGYGMCFGHNERKAIAMAGLDLAVFRDGGRSDIAQQVLITLDGAEANGFLEHLKLPHYVDFRSLLERKGVVRVRQSTTRESELTVGDPA